MVEKRKRDSITIKLIVVGIILFLFCVGFAFFWYRIFRTDKVAVSNLMIALKDKGEGIDIKSLVPIHDSDNKSVPAYSFDIINNGEIEGRYQVLIEDSVKKDSDGYKSQDLITREQLKYELVLNGQVIAKDYLSNIKNNLLDERLIGRNKTNAYQLRIWIPMDADDWQNKTYHYKIVVNAVNEGE